VPVSIRLSYTRGGNRMQDGGRCKGAAKGNNDTTGVLRPITYRVTETRG